jgi:hypothetical protein
MEGHMKAYRIDPDRQTISVCTVQHDTLISDLHRFIGEGPLDQGRINRDRDQVWVSDTGLLDGLTRFSISSRDMPLAGKAMVIGCDKYGEAQDPVITLDELKTMVRF